MTQFKDFIGVFPNALSEVACDQIVASFAQVDKLGKVVNRQTDDGALKINKDNEYFYVRSENIGCGVDFNIDDLWVNEFVAASWACYEQYAQKYGVLGSLARHQFYMNIKVQKISPTEGYHVWHCEHATRASGSRLLLVLAYLNDVEEGGETEFLYQSRRISPKQGTIMICPSGFTHTHRGNPPLSGDKYIINGWIEFIE
jgi:hypothetical protein